MSQEVKNEPEQETNELDGLENHYLFSPSITKHRTICGRSYTVKCYFNGKKDIPKTITRLAEQQAYKAS